MYEGQIIILIVGLGLSWSIVAFLLIAMFLGKKADKERQDSYLAIHDGKFFSGDVPEHEDCRERVSLIPIEEDKSISYDQFDAEEGFFEEEENSDESE